MAILSPAVVYLLVVEQRQVVLPQQVVLLRKEEVQRAEEILLVEEMPRAGEMQRVVVLDLVRDRAKAPDFLVAVVVALELVEVKTKVDRDSSN